MRRAIGAAVVVMGIGGLMLAISEGSRAATPYADAHALASALSTAGAGWKTVYPTRSVGGGDRAVCSVASGDVTI